MNCRWNCQKGICLSFDAGYDKSKCKNMKIKTAEDYWAEFSQESSNGRLITEANFKEAIRVCQKEIMNETIHLMFIENNPHPHNTVQKNALAYEQMLMVKKLEL